jgi:hypothetical protein
MKIITKKQGQIIRKFTLERNLQLNVVPESVDGKVVRLSAIGEISQEECSLYVRGKTKPSRVYPPTFWSSISSLFKSYYSSLFT